MRAVWICGALLWAGCLKAPEIVVVDRATALEQQAAGSQEELENKLARTAMAPRPLPLTPEELDALGVKRPDVAEGTALSDADQVDRLLRQRCVGEGRDGLLIATPSACQGATDEDTVARLVDATNRARASLWRWMHETKPGLKPEALRKAWKEAHRKGIICGAWEQRDDGEWEAKKC